MKEIEVIVNGYVIARNKVDDNVEVFMHCRETPTGCEMIFKEGDVVEIRSTKVATPVDIYTALKDCEETGQRYEKVNEGYDKYKKQIMFKNPVSGVRIKSRTGESNMRLSGMWIPID